MYFVSAVAYIKLTLSSGNLLTLVTTFTEKVATMEAMSVNSSNRCNRRTMEVMSLKGS